LSAPDTIAFRCRNTLTLYLNTTAAYLLHRHEVPSELISFEVCLAAGYMSDIKTLSMELRQMISSKHQFLLEQLMLYYSKAMETSPMD
jgi:hypothetical protein